LYQLENYTKEKIDCIEEVYTAKNALVSQIYWKHILNPLEYPIFDRRVLRTFCLLDKGRLWLKGAPSGKRMLEEDYKGFRNFIKNKDHGLTETKIFINHRLIDWALFGFDKLVTQKLFDNGIEINKKLDDLLTQRIQEAICGKEKWKINYPII
jgi:hypothetical protein